MNWLTTAKEGQTQQVPAGIEERMVWLCSFGTPRLSRASGGWHARIEMNTNTTGAKFEIVTDFDCETPSKAVDDLIARMLQTLSKLTAP